MCSIYSKVKLFEELKFQSKRSYTNWEFDCLPEKLVKLLDFSSRSRDDSLTTGVGPLQTSGM